MYIHNIRSWRDPGLLEANGKPFSELILMLLGKKRDPKWICNLIRTFWRRRLCLRYNNSTYLLHCCLPAVKQWLLDEDNRNSSWEHLICGLDGGPAWTRLLVWYLSPAPFAESGAFLSPWDSSSKLWNRSKGTLSSQPPGTASLPSIPSYSCLPC